MEPFSSNHSDSGTLAPIILFVYSRPEHTRKTLENLRLNDLSGQSELFIYSDGPPANASASMIKDIQEVRMILKEKSWCGKVHICEYEFNNGLPNIILKIIENTLDKYGKIIVIEDDLVLSKGFLKYMNAALDLYADKPEVMHISGYMFPTEKALDETFFLTLTTCWGWGTWKRAWKFFNPSAKELQDKIISRKRMKQFDMDGQYAYSVILKRCADGIKNHWDLRWYASVFLMGGLCLHPRMSLVRNIGHDRTGVNCGESDLLSNQAITENIQVSEIPLTISVAGKKSVFAYYKSIRPQHMEIPPKLKDFFKKTLPQPLYEFIRSFNQKKTTL
jgi:hypothetical protein